MCWILDQSRLIMLKSACANRLQASSLSALSPGSNSILLITLSSPIANFTQLHYSANDYCQNRMVSLLYTKTTSAAHTWTNWISTAALFSRSIEKLKLNFAEWPRLLFLPLPPSDRGSFKAWSMLIMSDYCFFRILYIAGSIYHCCWLWNVCAILEAHPKSLKLCSQCYSRKYESWDQQVLGNCAYVLTVHRTGSHAQMCQESR